VCIAYANFGKDMQISGKKLAQKTFKVPSPAYQPQAFTNI